MEKSMGVTVEKVRNYVPDDIVFSILSKLPLKSVKRFGCISKSWATLFENPYFMRIFWENFISENHSYYDDTSLLLHPGFNDLNLYSLFGEMFENMAKLVLPNPFDLGVEEPYLYVLDSGSITGILCLYQDEKNVVLWNPTTGELKIVPPSPTESLKTSVHVVHVLGFGYDHIRDDYKLIRNVSYECLFEIYSLRSNSWRQLDVSDDYRDDYRISGNNRPTGERIYMDGMCHWWGFTIHENEFGNIMTSFDLSNEVFFTTPIPSNIVDNLCFKLEVLNGSIGLISWNFDTPTFYIYILGELGIQESWTKLFIIGPLPSLERPIGAGKKGDIFFRTPDGEIVWFSLATQLIKELGTKGNAYSNILLYKENLISMAGINH